MLAADPVFAAAAMAPSIDAELLSATAEIRGSVYQMSSNGAHAGIAAVELRLLNEVGAVVGVTHTGADGAYAFPGLAAGLYAVQQMQPAGFADGPESLGAAGGQVLSDDLLGEIALAPGQAAAGYDFAEFRPADAPASEGNGLPRLILAGGGVAGPGVVAASAPQLRIWTPPAPAVLDLAALPTSGVSSPNAIDVAHSADNDLVEPAESVEAADQDDPLIEPSPVDAEAELVELTAGFELPAAEWDAAHEQLDRLGEADDTAADHGTDPLAWSTPPARRADNSGDQQAADSAEDAPAAPVDAPPVKPPAIRQATQTAPDDAVA